MDIKILGSGCRKCITLEEHARNGAAELGIDTSIEMIHDPVAIAGYGVMRTPALVIDEQVVVAGRVPAAEEVRSLLSAASIGR
ncbi:thioredoxin family protein [Synechococcus sp. CS-1328]|uniref:thioredoxin family protein n=1 Tax=Synechococcus sp. CS-1328 TaxID=2847976 RepID=UPI00223AF6E2|nr:thioredoxin family protein [Synechococcus sp. CS-1328]MCT0224029.1 thioredoxin family protein [Synechococcus sp. CS-1328]